MTTINDYSDLVTDDHRVLDMATNGGTPYDELLLWIEQDGAVSIGIRTYYGGDGTPMDEWHNRTLVYTLVGKGGAHIDLDALRADLKPEGRLAPLITRIAAGLDSKWDGSNMVGTLTNDASEADEALEALLDVYGVGRSISDDWVDGEWSTWDTADWLCACRDEIAADMTDAALAAWASGMEAQAESDRVRLVGEDVIDWARAVREDKRAEAAEAAE
ncbi:MAG: hypothetical protein RL291_60 [Pseudomonadota bacterium]|jgi:hypothetical protein